MPLLCRMPWAPCNGTTSTPPNLVVMLAPNHSTLPWHPTMAPCNGTTSTPPKLAVTLPPNHSTLQWHTAMAPSNGTTSTPPKLVVTLPQPLRWHPAMAARPLPQSWSSTPSSTHTTMAMWQCAMAPSNGTTSTAPCNGTLVPRPISQSGSSPSPPIGSKNPYSYRYLGKKNVGEMSVLPQFRGFFVLGMSLPFRRVLNAKRIIVLREMFQGTVAGDPDWIANQSISHLTRWYFRLPGGADR